jgi:hypothetical protein
MVIVGPDQLVSGKTWKNVEDPDGNIGWAAGDFLTAIVATAIPLSPTQVPATPTQAAPTATAIPPTPTLIPPTSFPPTNTPAPATVPVQSVNSSCVANVAASVKYPHLGGVTQTLYVVATNASSGAVAGASRTAYAQYSTIGRNLILPATASDGTTAVARSVGGHVESS